MTNETVTEQLFWHPPGQKQQLTHQAHSWSLLTKHITQSSPGAYSDW